MILSRWCECYICGEEKLTDKSILPLGWAVLWDIPITVCDGCLAVWERRFGEKPMSWVEGGVKELTLFEEL